MFEEFLAHLDESGVRFVVVGGLAVVIHGYARLPADVDLVLDLDPDNVRRAMDALTARGLRPLLPVNAADFADRTKRREWIAAAKERTLEASFTATASERLRWLEEALAFAVKRGAIEAGEPDGD